MDIQELEKIMVNNGFVIRAIPQTIVSVIEKRNIDKYPNGVVQYIERFNREMLVVESVLKHTGKFIIEKANIHQQW